MSLNVRIPLRRGVLDITLYTLILESHVILSVFDWIKKLRLFVNERNLKIFVVLKASRGVVIRWFSLNKAHLGLFKFTSDYLHYFENFRKIIVTVHTVTIIFFWSYDYFLLELRLYSPDGYFLGNETIYGIKNTHIQQIRTDQPCGWVILDNNRIEWRN
jgi:hypothetical protein